MLSRQNKDRDSFTLIELLVVIAIAAILLATAIPTFQSFTRQSITTAVPGLTSTLRLARQYALTRRTDVYVIFPDQDVTYNGSQVLMALRSYAAIHFDRMSGNFEYLSEWKTLPEGVYFDDVLPPAGVANKNVFLTNPTNSFPFPDEGSPQQDMPAILFRPNGKVYAASVSGPWISTSEIYVYMHYGVMDVNTNVGTISSFQLMEGTNVAVIVRPLTGSVSVDSNT